MLTSFGKFILEGGVPVYLMLGIIIFGITVVYERVNSLFFKFTIKTDDFMKHLKSLLLSDKIEEAIAFCSSQGQAMLPKVIKNILERSDRDDENIRNAHDIASMEVIPQITKGMGYLVMIANVATLLGLLGTIYGLIMSFQAVSFADPSQKQTLLAQGISHAMNFTAMGLLVAIPVMILYAFLQSRQNKLIEEIVYHSAKVVDMLISRNYEPFDEKKAYSTNNQEVPAPSKRKTG
ncbi:MAG: MotA/TolQ/ExbB proton channel family protein [Oligoflexia bacterium]|nr:MotA/TolQ/ExbB proton channel family protein [Oligoflexia bacterium]